MPARIYGTTTRSKVSIRRNMAKTQKEIEDAEIKRTLLTLAKEHKERCQGDCTISLVIVKLVLEKLGIPLAKEENETLM